MDGGKKFASGASAEERSDIRPPGQLLYEPLTGTIRQAAFDVHRYFGPGFLEKVYERSLQHRLEQRGLRVSSRVPMTVRDEDGTVVGDFVADLLVEEVVIVEVKAVAGLTDEHRAQVLSYLKATGKRVGMLINLGRARLQVRRFSL